MNNECESDHKHYTCEFRSIEYKKKMSKIMKQYYREHPEKHPARLLANNRNHMSYPEKVAFDWFVKNNIEFKHHFHFKNLGLIGM